MAIDEKQVTQKVVEDFLGYLQGKRAEDYRAPSGTSAPAPEVPAQAPPAPGGNVLPFRR